MKKIVLLAIISLCIGIAIYFFILKSAPASSTARIAVAANFFHTLKKLKQVFEEISVHRITIILGSSGKLYTQIKNGVPVDVFFSADIKRPKLLEQDGYAVLNTFFVYAKGRLVLWSKHPQLVDANGEVLGTDKFKRLAIAPIKKAPYGAAAKQVLKNIGLWEKLWPRIIQSTNLTHLYQLIDNDNADLGFLALSQLIAKKKIGSQWIVPQKLYDPLEQGVVLLKRGQNNAAAKAFMQFLQSAKARSIIEKFGYEAP